MGNYQTLSTGVTILTLDKEASGQWMGEIGRSLLPVVRDIGDPRMTPRGHLGFVVESGSELPLRLEKVSINITRTVAL